LRVKLLELLQGFFKVQHIHTSRLGLGHGLVQFQLRLRA
jgi:hypothetical protein